MVHFDGLFLYIDQKIQFNILLFFFLSTNTYDIYDVCVCFYCEELCVTHLDYDCLMLLLSTKITECDYYVH